MKAIRFRALMSPYFRIHATNYKTNWSMVAMGYGVTVLLLSRI